MNEFLSTLRSVHLLLIAVSLALGSFALSPRDSALYHAAQLEAESLTKVKFSDFALDATLAQIYLEKEYVANIRASLAAERDALVIEVDPHLRADLFLQVRWPMQGEPIEKIREFVDDFRYALLSTEVPQGDEAWKEIFGNPGRNRRARCVMGPRPIWDIQREMIEHCPSPAPGGQLVDIDMYEIAPTSSGREAFSNISGSVLRERVDGDFAQVFIIQHGEELVRYVTRNVDYQEPDALRRNYACVFILEQIGAADKFAQKVPNAKPGDSETPWETRPQRKTSPCHEADSPSDDSEGLRDHFRRLFPHLDVLWSQVAHLSPAQAAEQLSVKTMQSRQSLSIGGLSIDERVVAVAGPATVLSVSVYLLVNLIMLRTTLASASQAVREPLHFPWFCLHEDRLSRMLTWMTIALLPSLSIYLALRTADGQWDWGRAFGVSALCIVLACVYISLGVIRQIKQLAATPT